MSLKYEPASEPLHIYLPPPSPCWYPRRRRSRRLGGRQFNELTDAIERNVACSRTQFNETLCVQGRDSTKRRVFTDAIQRKVAFYLLRVRVGILDDADRDGWVDGCLRDQPVRHVERHLRAGCVFVCGPDPGRARLGGKGLKG